MIYNRQQFTDHWNQLLVDSSHYASTDCLDHPLWIPDQTREPQCEYFVCVRPLHVLNQEPNDDRIGYWRWCEEQLQGLIKCYSSSQDYQQEWWGFTHHDDIAFWMLKWT